MKKRLTALAAAMALATAALSSVTSGCDLSVDNPGLKSDTTGNDPTSPPTQVLGPAGTTGAR